MSDGFFSPSVLAQSRKPTASVPQCGACKLHLTCRSPKMPVAGEGRERILIVGEAPGKNEDDRGKPFVGQSGQILRDALREVGIDLDRDCWTTNALICRPPKNATPTNAQVEYCRPNIIRVLKDLQPELIIPLGQAAVQSVVGHIIKEKVEAMRRWAGWRIPCIEPNAWICPTFHPSYVLRTQDKDPVPKLFFRKHIAAAMEMGGRPHKDPPDYRKQVELIIRPADAAKLIRTATKECCDRGLWAAFDYECNMLKPEPSYARIYSCAISWADRTIAYPWHGEAITATQEFLRSPCEKVAANMKFEDRWTRAEFGHRVRNWRWDTMQAGHVLDCRKNISGLKFQSFVNFGVPPYNHHIEPYLQSDHAMKPNRIDQIELQDLLLYNGLDALLEKMLAEKHQSLFPAKGFYDVED